MKLPPSLQNLIDEFNKLPGIGVKTAQRLSFYLLRQSKDKLQVFGNALIDLKDKLLFCEICQNITELSKCEICSNLERDFSSICVVAEPLDVIALEKAGVFQGVYHVLHGLIAPLEGVSPADLTIDLLTNRVQSGQVKEMILATNPTLEGEATALYLQKKYQDFSIKITRLAKGLPTGSDIEYADSLTLKNALKGRLEF